MVVLSHLELDILAILREDESSGLSFGEIKEMMKTRSRQGLINALTSLQGKGLVYRDIFEKKKGSSGVYRARPASSVDLFIQDAASFMLREARKKNEGDEGKAPPIAKRWASATAAAIAEVEGNDLGYLHEDLGIMFILDNLRSKMCEVWIKHRIEFYQQHREYHPWLKKVQTYESALAKYLSLLGYRADPRDILTKVLPIPAALRHTMLLYDWEKAQARKDIAFRPKQTPMEHERPLRFVDYALRETRLRREHVERDRKLDPELQKIERVLQNKRKKEAYHDYLARLTPPKTLLVAAISGFEMFWSAKQVQVMTFGRLGPRQR